MKKLFLSSVFLFSVCIIGYCQSTNILFDKNSYSLNQQSKVRLDSVIRVLKKSNPQQEICLVGHTDSDADAAYNKTLSLNRSLAIKDYFLLNGISNTIHIESKGETKLINSNTTELEKSLNRRVEIIQDYKPSNSIFTQYAKPANVFEIDPNRDTVVICNEGTKIRIDHWIFNNVNTSLPIIIQVQEYLTKSDFVFKNLTTTHSDGRIIESRGMIYIEAHQNDQALTLKEGKTIDVLFKDRVQNDSTELFLGTNYNSNIIWNQTRTTPFTADVVDNTYRSSYSTAKRENTSKKKGRKKNLDFTTNYAIYEQSIFDTINGVPCKIVQKYAKQKYTTDTLYVTSDPKIQKEYEELIAYRKEMEERRQYKKDMDLLMLSSPKLGWINCDRFYNNEAPRMDVVIEYQESYIPSFVLVFKNINSVLPYSYRVDNKIIFKNIPVNTAFDIVGLYTNTMGTELFLAQKSAAAINGNVVRVTFKTVSIEEMMKALKNMN